MSLDARVKGALERSSQIVDPDVRRDLSTVRRKERRLALRQRILAGGAAAALIVATFYLGPKVVDVIRHQRHIPAGPPSPPALIGDYHADLSGAGGPLATRGVAGPWTLALLSDGRALWTAPSGSGLFEGLPSDTYQASASEIVTSLFASSLCRGEGIATYRWSLSEGSLTLAPITDGCAVRRAILGSTSWAAGS